MKIALLGGSFDPVHYGHLQMAKEAMQVLKVDEVWFIPAKKTPLKDRILTSDTDRLAMLKIALADFPQFKVNPIEMQREGISYTIDTLEALHRQYPSYTFYWLIGNDQLEQFDLWKDPDRLVQLAYFVCFDRDGKLAQTKYPIQQFHMEPMPVSSSEIRKGNKLNYLDEEVLRYVYQHRLYVKDFIKERVSPKRFSHSVSVAHLCEEFAKAHDLDTQKAYYIGLFHDVAKNLSKEVMEPWMDCICPENKKYPVAVWHGFVGSEIIKRVFYIYDDQISHAIYHHVLGTSHDPYAMIIFCADKLDPLRGYPVKDSIACVKQDLAKGFEMVQEENRKYLKGKGN